MTPEERDLIARTIVGEAAGQPFAGQQAVANVILNRVNSGKYGGSVADVLFAPKQFEPWTPRRDELMAVPTSSPAYGSAIQALDAAAASDVTGGATHFLNPDIVRQRRGGSLPSWAQGPGMTIGQHTFFAPGGTLAAGSAAAPPVTAAAPMRTPPSAAAPTPLASAPNGDVASVFAAMTPSSTAPMAATQRIVVPSLLDTSPLTLDPAFMPRTTKRTKIAGQA